LKVPLFLLMPSMAKLVKNFNCEYPE
jgi:hypothetical protein